jgi:hypothetical protein
MPALATRRSVPSIDVVISDRVPAYGSFGRPPETQSHAEHETLSVVSPVADDLDDRSRDEPTVLQRWFCLRVSRASQIPDFGTSRDLRGLIRRRLSRACPAPTVPCRLRAQRHDDPVGGSHLHSYACRIDHRGHRTANQRRSAIPQSLRGQPQDCEARDGRDSARVRIG